VQEEEAEVREIEKFIVPDNEVWFVLDDGCPIAG
jgi:hypothetical protein